MREILGTTQVSAEQSSGQEIGDCPQFPRENLDHQAVYFKVDLGFGGLWDSRHGLRELSLLSQDDLSAEA